MSFSETQIAHLILKKLTSQLSAEENSILRHWRKSSAANESKYEELIRLNVLQSRLAAFDEAVKQSENVNVPIIKKDIVSPAHRVHFLRKWGWAAAVFVIAISTTVVILLNNNRKKNNVLASIKTTNDILPGANKALLTLSDGTTITLDSAANGAIAQQGNAEIIKLANGEIQYAVKGLPQGEVMINTMSTPRGGQYQLVLPDGSKIWLNAASSVTYPAAFVGKERKIKISGEIYLEVAKNKQQPFIVDVDGKSLVEVLGTSFNINSYADEGSIKTTLVEGSVKVLQKGISNHNITLRPGQQAIVLESRDEIEVNDNTNIEQVLAWKNGIFDFTGSSFHSLMKDVERWYDVQVKYNGNIPAFKMKGEMDRGVPLSDLIRFLKEYGLNVKLEGRVLIVSIK